MLEEVIKKTQPPVDPQLDPGNGRILTPSPVLVMYILPTLPTAGTVFKDIAFLERAMCCWDLLDGIRDWTQFTKDLRLNLHVHLFNKHLLYISDTIVGSRNTKMNYMSLPSWKRNPCLAGIKFIDNLFKCSGVYNTWMIHK